MIKMVEGLKTFTGARTGVNPSVKGGGVGSNPTLDQLINLWVGVRVVKGGRL